MLRDDSAPTERLTMNNPPKTVIVTGASQGIGAGIVRAFLARGYNVVGTARNATKSRDLSASDHLALIDGDIGQFETAQQVAELALKKFGSIDAVVANAGIFMVKPFTEYTTEDFRALVATNLSGFIYVAQLAVKQMQAQRRGGSIVSISAALADNPIAGVPASLPMITKGGLNAVIRSLALEYAKEHIRFNAVAPGVVETPLHADDSNDVLKTLSPMGTISTVEEIAGAVVYLTEARQITGEVLHVDGGAHVGKW
jgi:NAD(P)-dependent dehydrogenase (short-subunit alcohol dehydrogenase family)